MSDTGTLRIPRTGWTVADHPAATGHPAASGATVDAGDLAAATEGLHARAVEGQPVSVRLTPAGLELTIVSGTCWETAVVSCDTTTAPAHAAADLVGLSDLAQRLAADRATAGITITTRGRLQIDGVDLPTVGHSPAPAPRPVAGGIVEHRVDLPPSLPDGVPIRLPGVAVCVPAEVRNRLTRHGISMANLFQVDDRWYLSGIAQGRPMFVVVGEVAVY